MPLLTVACLAAASLVAVAIATDNPAPTHFDRLSNTGVPVTDVAAKDIEALQSSGGKGELRLLDEREGVMFFTAPALHGGLCFAVGPASTKRISVLFCPGQEAAALFPSDDSPILDMSGKAFSNEGGVIFLQLVGFAADGIADVAVIDSNGTRHAAAVQRNVFARRMMPGESIQAIVALDASGKEVFRRDVSIR
ncbi:MAG: hypothetical protein ACRDKU_02530 [Gaiellaceae bacterium]